MAKPRHTVVVGGGIVHLDPYAGLIIMTLFGAYRPRK